MEQVMVIGCNGIGNPLSTVSRYASFRTAEILRERGVEVEIMAIGRLLGRLDEDVEAAKRSRVALMEGCSFRCAKKLLKNLGIEISTYVYIPEVMLRSGISRRGLDRKFLGPKGKALVEAVAQFTADAVCRASEPATEPIAVEGACE